VLLPYGWLCELVEVPWSPSELADRLSGVGVKVEAVREVDFHCRDVVVARIVSVLPHPDNPRARIVTLSTGSEPPRQVVSTAPGLAPGHRVPLALPGARLPGDRRVELEIFGGARSEGMLCSLTELACGQPPGEGEGVLILPEAAVPGQPVDQLLESPLTDWVLELELTVNYAMHCQSVLGVAREVAALTGMPCRPREYPVVERGAAAEDWVGVEVRDGDGCPRYVARVLHELEPGPSPCWMQRRLAAAGLRPRNRLVDITNYVLLELGQPLHAFDRDRLAENRIVVRRAAKGERLLGLDGVERALTPGMLVIADARQPVALAGIIGGVDTGITPTTRAVVLESAHFHPGIVRRASLKLGIRTDASSRFEKWSDPEAPPVAADRAAALLGAIGAGKVAPGRVEVCPRPFARTGLRMRVSKVNRLLGTSLSASEAVGRLQRLGFEAEPIRHGRQRAMPVDTDVYLVTVPSWRGDVTAEVDLVEEVARSGGYDELPSCLPRGTLTIGRRSARLSAIDEVASILAAAGLDEIVTSPLIGAEVLDRLRLAADDPMRDALRLANPLAEDQALLRPTLIPGMIEAMAHNAGRRQVDLGLFEVGPAFIRRGELSGIDPRAVVHQGGDLSAWVAEEPRVVLGLMGRRHPAHWQGMGDRVDFFDLKGLVELLGARLSWGQLVFEPASHPSFHPSRQARLRVDGQERGLLGELHPEILAANGLDRALVAEVGMEPIPRRGEARRRLQPLPRHPAVYRDVSFITAASSPAATVEAVIREAAGPLLEKLTLFDVYQGEAMAPGTRSLAYALVYRAADRTLTDQEVDPVHSQVRQALVDQLGAILR
jgi:phenylalanyl-tRNA synthetase beta chain